MKWAHFKNIFLEHNLTEGDKTLTYFDECKASKDNFIFGVKLYFNIDYTRVTWNKDYRDLAVLIMFAEMSGDFEKMNYIIFENKRYTVVDDSFVNKILNSDIFECKIYGDPTEVHKSSMWVRFLDDPCFEGSNLEDELTRQRSCV